MKEWQESRKIFTVSGIDLNTELYNVSISQEVVK